MCPNYILRPTKIIIKGAGLKIKAFSVIKKEKKKKERKEKNNQKISTSFVISTNNLINCVRLLKRWCQPKRILLHEMEKQQQQQQQRTNKETSKIK